jgi:hypothetical protein
MDRPRTRSTRYQSGSEDATLSASQHAQPEPSGTREPPVGSPMATLSLDGSEDEEAEEVGRERSSNSPISPEGPRVARNGPTVPIVSDELQEMRTWLENTKAQEELRALRELRARYDAGDTAAVRAVSQGQGGLSLPPVAPAAALPRPEPPHSLQSAIERSIIAGKETVRDSSQDQPHTLCGSNRR